MPKTKMSGFLEVRDLALSVNLGWTRKERKQKQKIHLTLYMQFEKEPRACQTDELRDTICYDTLIKKIRGGLAGKQFRLVEHLAAEIYQIVIPALPKDVQFYLFLDKHPKIRGLAGGIRFGYGG